MTPSMLFPPFQHPTPHPQVLAFGKVVKEELEVQVREGL